MTDNKSIEDYLLYYVGFMGLAGGIVYAGAKTHIVLGNVNVSGLAFALGCLLFVVPTALYAFVAFTSKSAPIQGSAVRDIIGEEIEFRQRLGKL